MGGSECKQRTDDSSIMSTTSAGSGHSSSINKGGKSEAYFDDLVEWRFVYESLTEVEKAEDADEDEESQNPEIVYSEELICIQAQSRRSRITNRGKWGTIYDDVAEWLRPECRASWSELAKRVDPSHRQVLLQGIADFVSASKDHQPHKTAVTPRPDLELYEPYVVSPILSTARLGIGSMFGVASSVVVGDEFTMKAGSSEYCTGDFGSAHVLLFSDEGAGEIYVYPYDTADQASLATKDWWSTRVTFCLTEDGEFTEIDWAGPELYRSIRQAAACIPVRL